MPTDETNAHDRTTCPFKPVYDPRMVRSPEIRRMEMVQQTWTCIHHPHQLGIGTF